MTHRRWFTGLALLCALAWGATTPAEAVSNLCPDAGGTQYLVDTPADAADIAGGYVNVGCDLAITTDVAPTVVDWDVFAKSFSIAGAKVINTAVNSAIHVTVPLAITCLNAELKARSEVFLRSTSALGSYSAVGCKTIASSTLDPYAIPGVPASGPALGGNLTIQAFGGISQVGTDTYGGSRVHFISNSDIAFLCVPGPQQRSACDDPSLICPGGFPCIRDFLSAQEFLQVACQATPPSDPPICEGGANEFRLTATGNVNIAGSIFKWLSHASFESAQGAIEAAGTSIHSVTDLNFKAKSTINAVGASWSAGRTLRAQTGPDCTTPSECITATNAGMLAGTHMLFSTQANQGGIDLCGGAFTRLAAGLPSMNGDQTLPYPASVKQDAAACAPLPAAVIQ